MMKTSVLPGRSFVSLVFVAAVAVTLLVASSAGADDFERRRDNHPLALVRYIFYPLGSLLEYTVFRPAHQVASLWIPADGCFASASGCDTDRKQRQRYRSARR